MATSHESLSAQSKRRTTWILSLFGLLVVILFFVVLCSAPKEQPVDLIQTEPVSANVINTFGDDVSDDDKLPDFSVDGTQLVVSPQEVAFDDVVLGATAEATVLLRAENGPLVFVESYLADISEHGFVLSGDCMERTELDVDEECVLKVSWTPVKVQSIQNTLTIVWHEDNSRVLKDERSQITLKGTAIDSKECVCCENCGVENKPEKKPRPIYVLPDGTEVELPEGAEPPEEGIVKNPEGEVLGVTEPRLVALNLKNEFLGFVTDSRTVEDKEGKLVGRLLLDNTVVDSDFNVLGAAIPLVSVINSKGAVVGKLTVDKATNELKVVDGAGKKIGTPRVDQTVFDDAGIQIGVLRSWGMAMDLSGNVLGIVLPTGAVIDSEQKVQGFLQQNGFIVNTNGVLVGSVVKQGIAVGLGGRSFGEVSLNGSVKDVYGQVVGRVMPNGDVVDANMNTIGAVIGNSLVVDMDGNVLGFVNSEGKAVDGKGSLMGNVAPDGSVYTDKQVLGGVLQKGRVVGNSCNVLGSVYPDGSVVTIALQPIGKVRSDGYTLNDSSVVMGVVVPRGTVLAEGCRLMGLLSLSGQVIDQKGNVIGCINLEKEPLAANGQSLGVLTPTGALFSPKGDFSGRVRYDGQIIDKNGKVIGCVNSNGTSSQGDTRTYNGAVLNDVGLFTGWTCKASKCMDTQQNEVGTQTLNGWVLNKARQIVGLVHPDSFIFDMNGRLIGTYNAFMGQALSVDNKPLGRLMPDGTVLDMTATRIVGRAFPKDSYFADFKGAVLGRFDARGQVVNASGQVIGKVLADGAVYNSNNELMGGVLGEGVVLSSSGDYVGMVSIKGDVMMDGTKVASLLPNEIAVTPDNRVVGALWNKTSVVVSSAGVIGFVVPDASTENSMQYQASVFDKNASYVGAVSGFGTVLGVDGRLVGTALPLGMVVDLDGHFMGFVRFNGDVENGEGKTVGQLGVDGFVFDAAGKIVGTVVKNATVVDKNGLFIGRVAPDGGIYNGNGFMGMTYNQMPYLTNADSSLIGRPLLNGLALNATGEVMGWTGFNGSVMNMNAVVGRVAFNNRVNDIAGTILGGYVPFGAYSLNEDEKMCGIMTETGSVVSASGSQIGTVAAPDYVMNKGSVVGRIHSTNPFARGLTSSSLMGVVGRDSLVYKPQTNRSVGELMMNDFIVDSDKMVVGTSAQIGFANSHNLKSLGMEDWTGAVWLGGKVIGTSFGNGFVEQGGSLIGGIFNAETIIDKAGKKIGESGFGAQVWGVNGQKIGSRMAFSSVLTPETIWAGGPLKTGFVVDDYAQKVGVVTADGSVMFDKNFKGRVLPDGSVAGVSEPAVYNTMPYVGHLVVQGVPVGYNPSVLGRTTVDGHLIDASGSVKYQILDDATILGKERPLEGQIVPFLPVLSLSNSVLGFVNGLGKVVNEAGEEVAALASNGAALPLTFEEAQTLKDKLQEVGGVLPETLVVDNSCKVIGQTAYDGTVVDGQGNVIGRMQPKGVATDPMGKELGFIVRYGPITSEKGVYLGRTLPDSTVVNPDGVVVGCVGRDKLLRDANGEPIGRLRARGPVFNNDKVMFGRVDAMGRVVGTDGKPQGTIGGLDNDDAYDFNGNKIGWMASNEDRLIFNPGGTLDYTISIDGEVKTGDGTSMGYYNQTTGTMTDKYGNTLPGFGDENDYVLLYDLTNKPVARLFNCELFKIPGEEKMGLLEANGNIRDEAGDIILTSTTDGKVYNPDGTDYGWFRGLGMDLRRCGLASIGERAGGRKITWGGKTYEIDPDTGMLVNGEGKVVGAWDPSTLRPYIWETDKTSPEYREPPPPPKEIVIPDEVKEQFLDLQKKRRLKMKEKMGSVPTILPGKAIQAKAKGKKDKDWSSVDVDKNVSTWSVDMSRVLLADKAIPAVLVRSIDTRYPTAPVTAIVERHIYAEEGRNILIPAGSRLIGSLSGSAMEFGTDQAAKIDISWNRLIRPDGAAFKFEAVSGDAQGRGGVAAYLDMQLMRKFLLPVGSSIGEAIVLKLTELNEKSVIASSSTASNGTTTSETPGSQIRKMFIDNFKDIWGQLMEMSGEVPNILYVPSGTRLTAFSNTDLWLRSVDDDVEDLEDQGLGDPSAAQLPSVNDSWVEKRTKSDEEETEEQEEEQEESDKIYVPEDTEDRKVDPVSPPIYQDDDRYF